MDAGEYIKMKVSELKDILTERGVSSKGLRKADLVLKCLETQNQQQQQKDGQQSVGGEPSLVVSGDNDTEGKVENNVVDESLNK